MLAKRVANVAESLTLLQNRAILSDMNKLLPLKAGSKLIRKPTIFMLDVSKRLLGTNSCGSEVVRHF